MRWAYNVLGRKERGGEGPNVLYQKRRRHPVRQSIKRKCVLAEELHTQLFITPAVISGGGEKPSPAGTEKRGSKTGEGFYQVVIKRHQATGFRLRKGKTEGGENYVCFVGRK